MMITQTASFISEDIKPQRYWNWAGNESAFIINLRYVRLQSLWSSQQNSTAGHFILCHRSTGFYEASGPSILFFESLEPFMAAPIQPLSEHETRNSEIGLPFFSRMSPQIVPESLYKSPRTVAPNFLELCKLPLSSLHPQSEATSESRF